MAEIVRSELPSLWRSMNEPRACRHLYYICPQTKGRFKRRPCYARSSTDVIERDRPRDFRFGTPLRAFARTLPGGEVAPRNEPARVGGEQASRSAHFRRGDTR